jgi:hypothetical protein
MIIGVDFDNTLVCYDPLFHQLATHNQWIDPATPVSKAAVRNAMRAANHEAQWVHLQGEVYGRSIAQASPFPHALAFFRACHHANIQLYIISHKTRHPAGGQSYDLHAAARRWLIEQGFCDPARGGLDESRVYFEATARAKLARIGQLRCDHFIDDLPEFLADPAFPVTTRKWLFDPSGNASASFQGGGVLASWSQALDRLIHERVAVS